MSKQAQLADGTILDFPDETPDDIMDAAIKHHVATENLKAAQAAKYPTAAEAGTGRKGAVAPQPGYVGPALEDMAHKVGNFAVEQGPEMVGAGLAGAAATLATGGIPGPHTILAGAEGAAAVRAARLAYRAKYGDTPAPKTAGEALGDVGGAAIGGAVQEAGPVLAKTGSALIDAAAARAGLSPSAIGSPAVAAARTVGPYVKNRLTPEQQSGVDLMKKSGVPTNLAIDTGSSLASGTKAMIQRLPGSSGIVEAGDQATASGLKDLATNLQGRVAGPQDRVDLGANIRSTIRSALGAQADTEQAARNAAIDEARSAMGTSKGALETMADLGSAKEAGAQSEKEAADTAYDAFRKVANAPANEKAVPVGTKIVNQFDEKLGQTVPTTVPDMQVVNSPVDLRPAKAALRPIFNKLKNASDVVRRDASPGYAALSDFMSQPDFISADDAISHVSALGKLGYAGAFKDFPAMGDMAAGIAKKAWGLTRDALDKTASDIDAKDILDTGRRLVGEKIETYGSKAAQGAAKAVETKPIESFIKDGNIAGVKSVLDQTNGTELPAMRSRLFDSMLSDSKMPDGSVNAVGFAKRWNSLSDELKRMVFTPEQIQKADAATAPQMIFGPAHPATQLAHLAEMNDAGAVTDALLSTAQKGTDTLSKLAMVDPDAPRKLGRLAIEDITDRMFATGELDKVDSAFNRWNALGRQKKNLLVGAENVGDIDAFFQAVKLAKKDANYSGSGKVAALAGYVSGGVGALAAGHPVTAAIELAGVPIMANQLAKIIYSPGGAAMLTRAMSLPAISPAAEALTERILGKAVTSGAISNLPVAPKLPYFEPPADATLIRSRQRLPKAPDMAVQQGLQ